jgi:hypothetical protein
VREIRFAEGAFLQKMLDFQACCDSNRFEQISNRTIRFLKILLRMVFKDGAAPRCKGRITKAWLSSIEESARVPRADSDGHDSLRNARRTAVSEVLAVFTIHHGQERSATAKLPA